MITFRRLSFTLILILALTFSTIAGDMSTGRDGDMSTGKCNSSPCKSGEMSTGVTADIVVRTVGLYQSLLAVL
jgi:hypothetical protein